MAGVVKVSQDAIVDAIKAMNKSIVASKTAIKTTSFENAQTLKNAVDAINTKVCQLFVLHKKSFATEDFKVQHFDTQFVV